MGHWVLNFTRAGTKDKKLMPQQARKLLQIGLWGIPPSAQLKDKLNPGDRVLVYVGAPDRIFVGDALLASAWHPWAAVEGSAEASLAATAGSFQAGVSLGEPRIWDKPVPLQTVWPDTQGAKSNPDARWYGAVASIVSGDFECILASGLGASVLEPVSQSSASSIPAHAPDGAVPQPAATELSPNSAHGIAESEPLFKIAGRLKRYLSDPTPINEDGTRAFFIDKWLEALGYSDFDDIEHGSAVSSGDFPDYVLRSGGNQVMAVEAKRIGHGLGPKEAAQIVKYGSVLGVRWGLLTDGRYLHLYDLPVTGVAPEDRLVLSIDLADFADREDFDMRIWPAASLLIKAEMKTGEGLERHAARELIRTRLTDSTSPSVAALRSDLQQRKVILSATEIVSLVEDLIG